MGFSPASSACQVSAKVGLQTLLLTTYANISPNKSAA